MKMEWVRQRVFECEVMDAWGPTRKRVIVRHRDDGVLYALTITIGHPLFDTRENIVREFAEFACQKTGCRPCNEDEFNETFMMNLRNYNGDEIANGLFYTFETVEHERVCEWEQKRWSRPIPQRIGGKDEEFLPQELKRGLP